MESAAEWIEVSIENLTIFAALFFANYVLALVCAVREVMNSRTSQGSIAWLLSLILLPFPTSLLYLVFGWKFFDDYADAQVDSGRYWRSSRIGDLQHADHDTTASWPVLTRVAELPFQGGNSAKLLIDGAATFESIFEGIRRARHTVFVQFYIIRDDTLGRQFAEVLMERARAGVDIYLLYDDVGCTYLPRRYLDTLRAAGVHVSSFNARHRFLRFYGPTRINYRNHRKIVVVDGHEAWVGGHNVADEYMGRDPHFGRWRDTHVHVHGPASLGCALVFREDWHWATGNVLPQQQPEQREPMGGQSVLVMPTGPADSLEDCAIAFTDVIAKAQRRLWIVSPYFVPGLETQTALYAAAFRGVDVRILLPEKADHMLVWLASYAHADQMVAHGIHVHRYTGGFLHQKVILVDDEIAGVGTVNFDNRSFNINFEVTLWFTDKAMIADVESMLEVDFASSRLTTEKILKGRGFAFRFLCQAARLFSPIL